MVSFYCVYCLKLINEFKNKIYILALCFCTFTRQCSASMKYFADLKDWAFFFSSTSLLFSFSS